MMPERAGRLPVVTIGGCLGAGKTTLVNTLLSHADGRRIVVFVNDFGEINIDFELIDTVVEDRISLKNGCVCCSLNDDLVGGIAGFARAADPPDTIAIEMSGVADPRALDASLGALEAAGLARLDARLYVVDADGFAALEFEDGELVIDIAAASDLVLLNKVDLVSRESVAGIRSTLEEACPFSTIVESRRCDIDADLIFAPRPARNGNQRIDNPAGARPADHDRKYRKWSGQSERPLDRAAFDRFAAKLAETCIRAKGIVRFSDEPESPYVFNLVGRRATLERGSRIVALRASEVVAIGEAGKLLEAEVERDFRALACGE